MALINCPDCGASVSSRAAACIKCGCPIAQANSSDTAAQRVTKHSNKIDDLEDEDFDDDLEKEDVDDENDDDDLSDEQIDDDLDFDWNSIVEDADASPTLPVLGKLPLWFFDKSLRAPVTETGDTSVSPSREPGQQLQPSPKSSTTKNNSGIVKGTVGLNREHSFINGICTNCGCSAHSVGHFGWKCGRETGAVSNPSAIANAARTGGSTQSLLADASRSLGSFMNGITGGQIGVALLALIFVLPLLFPKDPKTEYNELRELQTKRLEREANYERVRSASERVNRAATVEAIMRDRERHPESYNK